MLAVPTCSLHVLCAHSCSLHAPCTLRACFMHPFSMFSTHILSTWSVQSWLQALCVFSLCAPHALSCMFSSCLLHTCSLCTPPAPFVLSLHALGKVCPHALCMFLHAYCMFCLHTPCMLSPHTSCTLGAQHHCPHFAHSPCCANAFFHAPCMLSLCPVCIASLHAPYMFHACSFCTLLGMLYACPCSCSIHVLSAHSVYALGHAPCMLSWHAPRSPFQCRVRTLFSVRAPYMPSCMFSPCTAHTLPPARSPRAHPAGKP